MEIIAREKKQEGGVPIEVEGINIFKRMMSAINGEPKPHKENQ
jgi:hypothetical protein